MSVIKLNVQEANQSSNDTLFVKLKVIYNLVDMSFSSASLLSVVPVKICKFRFKLPHNNCSRVLETKLVKNRSLFDNCKGFMKEMFANNLLNELGTIIHQIAILNCSKFPFVMYNTRTNFRKLKYFLLFCQVLRNCFK